MWNHGPTGAIGQQETVKQSSSTVLADFERPYSGGKGIDVNRPNTATAVTPKISVVKTGAPYFWYEESVLQAISAEIIKNG
ncbi:hypothetical protein SFMTTN_0735 [Sulfuriferula multivorans]|uniref:Uncharacterized protein n=1 Tax=Sulfuriferula multivorans TaxID=1559896 RepID=A0A401JBI9_9PROT|nr:hypothetical protein SFMTTN_0735 [Sulfuriferula multivorans]